MKLLLVVAVVHVLSTSTIYPPHRPFVSVDVERAFDVYRQGC